MKKIFYIFTLIFLFSHTHVFSQTDYHLLSNWDYKRKTRAYEKIHKVIASTNGYIIAVGETLGDSSKDLDGLFLVIDAKDGSRALWKKFGTGGNEAFQSVVQNHDGTFTLVGYSQKTTKSDVDGWVLQLDLEGNKLFEAMPKSSSGQDEELWDVEINHKGELLAVGKQTVDKTDRAWAVQIGHGKIVSDYLLGNALIGEAKSLTAATDGNFVVIGNTSPKNRTHFEDIWVMKVDHTGNDQWGGARYLGDNGFQKAGDITPSALDGGFAIVGTTNSKSEGMTDMWLVKMDEQGEIAWNTTYGGHAADVGNSVVELSGGGYALFGHTWSYMPRAKNAILNLILTDPRGRELESEIIIIRDGEGDALGYSVAELLTNDNIVVAGNSSADKKEVFPKTYIGVYNYKTFDNFEQKMDEDRFGASLSQAISFSPAMLIDANGNNFLEANERGYLEIEVTNTKGMDLYNVTASVAGAGSPAELGYWKKIQLGALKAGQKKKLYVPVQAQGSLSGGTYQLDVNLDVNGTYAASSTAAVKSNQPNPAQLVVQSHRFTPNNQPQPGQAIQLTVDLANTGGLPAAGLSAHFGLPEGVRPMEAQTKNLNPLRPGEQRSVTFSFVYDATFNRNVIDVVFQTRGPQANPITQRFPIEIKPLTQDATASTTPKPNANANTRNMGDMMVWMSHDPDEKGSRTFATNNRDVNIKLKILTSRQLNKNNLSVYVNGNKHQGQKMDEVKLSSEGSGMGRYNYQNQLRLREGQNKVRVVYQDENGNDFSSEELVFDYSPKDKPNLYVLSIGVKHQDLQYTVKDAKDFAQMYAQFRDSKDRRVFRKVEVMEVTADDMTTANNIKAAFIRLGRMNIKDGDLVVIFVSSHGKINNRGDFILIPSDYNPELEELYSVNFQEDILKKLRMVDGNKLVFIDACHSGSAFSSGSRSMFDAASSKVMNDLIRASSGIEIIASCGDNEYSYEDRKWGNGAFTKSILEAFQGLTVDVGNGKKISADVYNEITGRKIDGKDQVITIEELKQFIQQRVPYLVRSTKVAPPTGQNPSNKSTELLPKEMGIFVVGPNN
jgi:hypothetical protein